MNCVLFTMNVHHLEFLALCRFVCLLSECMFAMVFSLIQEGPLPLAALVLLVGGAHLPLVCYLSALRCYFKSSTPWVE